jgi:hypothetical protein
MGSGAGLVIILMFLPDGVGSFVYRGRDRLLRELADRRKIVVPSLFADMAVPDAEVLSANGDGAKPKRKVMA